MATAEQQAAIDEIERRLSAGELQGEQRAAAVQFLTELASARPQQDSSPPPTGRFTVPTGDPTENLAGNIEQFLPIVDDPQALAESPLGQATLGAARSVDSLTRGIQQLASSPEEALALAEVEKIAREQFAPVDEGIGAEDAGEAALLLGSLLIPGGGPVNVAAKGLQLWQRVKQVGKTSALFGLLAGTVEGAKATTPEESRTEKALTEGAFVTAAGVGGNLFGRGLASSVSDGMLGRALGSAGLAAAGGKGNARAMGRSAFARFGSKIWGRAPADEARSAQIQLAKGKGGQEVRRARLLQQRSVAEAAKDARKQGMGPDDWDQFANVIKSMGRTRPLKAAKDEAATLGISTEALTAMHRREAQNVVSVLTEGLYKQVPETNRIVVDLPELLGRWGKLSKDPQFTKRFSKQTQQKIDDAVQTVRRRAQGAPAVTVEDLAQSTITAIHDDVDKASREIAELAQTVRSIPGSNPVGRGAAASVAVSDEEPPSLQDFQEFFMGAQGIGLADLFMTTRERAEQ